MDTSEERYERGGADLLLWIFWGGILFAVAGESALFLLADVGSYATSSVEAAPSITQFLAPAAIAAAMALGAVAVFVKRVGGGGMTTALICWMLAKSVAISGLVVDQTTGRHLAMLPFMAVFLALMGWMHPGTLSSDA